MTVIKQYPSAAQDWLTSIPVMQQSVLFSGIRGMDGLAKLHPAKMLVRFYRRCVLISAFEGIALTNPYDGGGGDFTGPSLTLYPPDDDCGEYHFYVPANGEFKRYAANEWSLAMQYHVDGFVRARDEMPLHYFTHMMHAFQILGVHHPDKVISSFWAAIYGRMANALHLWPESPEELDARLGDTEAGWKAREDAAGSCST